MNTPTPIIAAPETDPAMGEAQGKLSVDKVRQIAAALRRRAALSAQKIQTRENEAEAKGIETFLRAVSFDHIQEFVATWFACTTEYEPFVMAWTRVMRRVNIVDAQLTAHVQQMAAAEAAQPEQSAGGIIIPQGTK